MIIRLTYRNKWYADIRVKSGTEANTFMMQLWQEGRLTDTEWEVKEEGYDKNNRRKIQSPHIKAAILH